MQKNKLFKRNELIQIAPVDNSQKLSLSTHLAYNLILEKAHNFYNNKNRKSDVFEITFLELANYSQVTNSQFKLKLRDNLLNLLSTKVFTYDNKYIKTYFTLLSQFEINDNSIKVALPPVLIENLLKNNYYTCLDLIELQSFKSKYTLVIFEMLKRYNNNIPKLDIEKLKTILSYPDSYTNFDVKRRVLEQIKKELFEKNQIIFDWKIEKVGRTWKYIKFSAIELIKEKELEISEKLLKSINKARKNRFIDSSYSQKAMNKIISMYDEKDIIKALAELYKYNSEINNFQSILISKIDDIKSSKMPLKAVEVKIEDDIAISDSNEFKGYLNDFKKPLIEISKEDYELLYEIYLKDNDAPNFKSVRIGFDRMNKTKYKIIE